MNKFNLNIILFIVILNYFLNEIDGNVVNKIGIINSTNIYEKDQPNLLIKNTSENKRHGKSIIGLIDLGNGFNTGLDDESSINEQIKTLITPRITQPINPLLSMFNYHPNINDPLIQLALTNYISNQQNQPINKLFRDAKLSINNRERQNSKKPQKIHRQFDETIDDDDDDDNNDNDDDSDTLEIKETKSKKNLNNFGNILTLKDLIRSSVAEALIENNNKSRQAIRESDDLVDRDDDKKKTKPTNSNNSTSNTTTTTTALPINQYPGYYYGGNPQNTSNINFVQDTYGPPQIGYNYRPIYNQGFNNQGFNYQGLYGLPLSNQLSEPPAYNAEPFRPDYGYYEPDSNNFPNLVEPWPVQQTQPIYYAKGRQITQDDKSFNNGNTFVPSQRILRQT